MAERPTACPEWQEDLAGWLMAQLDPAREAVVAVHLASCVACRTEADSLLAVTAVSLATDPDGIVAGTEEPSTLLGERIVATIAAQRRTRWALRTGVVALAGAAAAIVAVLVLQQVSEPPLLRGEEVAFNVVPAGASVEVVVAPESGGSVVQLTASGLDPDFTYALWLTPPGSGYTERVPAGTFRPDDEGEVDARLHSALPAAEMGRVWATTPDGQIALDTEPAR